MLCRQFNGLKKTIILSQFCCCFFTLPRKVRRKRSLSLCNEKDIFFKKKRVHHFNNLIVKKSSHDDTKTSHSDWACSRSSKTPRAPVQEPLFYLLRNYLIIFTISTNYLRSQGNENRDSSWTNMPCISWITPFCLTDVVTECHHSKVLLDIPLLVQKYIIPKNT